MPRRRGLPATLAATALAVVAFSAGAPAYARARVAPMPTIDTVLARARIVNEPRVSTKTQVEEWDVSTDGMTGTQTVVRRRRDFTITTHVGPFTTAWGHVGTQTWQQDESGIVVSDRERADRLTARALERVREPVDAYAVVETFASGHVRRSYYDPRTFVLLRRERWIGGRFTYAAWDEFRGEGHGRVQASHYQGDDVDGKPYDYRLRQKRAGTSYDDAVLAVPHSRRLIEFPAGQRAARLPARFDHRRVIVRVAIARRSYDFLLDTGASGVVLSSDTARQLGLESYGSSRATGAASVRSGRVILPFMEVGVLRVRDVVARTAPLGDDQRRSHIAGFLGFDFIASCVLRVDYEHGTLYAYENGTVGTPSKASVLDVRLDSRVPVTSVRVGEATGDDFVVDTGAATTLLLFSHFTNAHRADVADLGVGAVLASSGIGVAANGIGGRIGIRPVQVRRFRFGNATFEEPIVYVAGSPHALGLDGMDGLVGASVLGHFTMYLDYANQRIMLEAASPR